MKKTYIFLLLVFLCSCLFAQDTVKAKEKIKNNTIKGIIFFFPSEFYFGFVSIGYERYITAKGSLNLTFNDFIYSIGDGGGASTESIIFSYNNYFSSEHKVINNWP